MGRRPSVFVRPVTMGEGRKLQRISWSAKDPVRLRRAIVVLMSAQGQTVKDITMLMQVGEDYVRDVIHVFNERGFDALDPQWGGGRPKTISDEVREHICLIARTSPADWKITACSTWSLSKLADHLIKQKVTAAISRETLRRIPREGKVSWKTATTWKGVHRPGVHRQDAPRPGSVRHSARRRTGDMRRRVRAAEPDAPQGQGMGAGEAPAQAAGHLQPLQRRDAHARRSRSGHRQAVLPHPPAQALARVPRPAQALRARWPGQKLYVVLDNFSPHKHVEVRTWTADNDVELVFLPTYGSWLNWIESEFAALRYFALNGTDHRSHGEQNAAIASYVRWRNARAEPKTTFAPDSPIRSWTDYPANAA
ncbi:helix-turn-helix domain-containing protein [Streptomyces olivaceoviridis]|uniref:Helix-turn-helix domain-containing protein n=1 Tax=Streptomyces olivaceoviridis TaxID=1921 RepID=A0ABW7VRD3_STROI